MLKQYMPSSSSFLEELQVHPPSITALPLSPEHQQEFKQSKVSNRSRKKVNDDVSMMWFNQEGLMEINYSFFDAICQETTKDVLFCGVVGRKDGKNTFLEEFLKIQSSCLKENENTHQRKQNRQIKVNKKPIFVKNNKIIYFLQYEVDKQLQTQHELEEQKTIDFLMMMCHFVIVDSSGSLEMFIKRASFSAARLNIFSDNSLIWPATVYLLDVEDKKTVDDLNQWFRRVVQISHSQKTQILSRQLLQDLAQYSYTKQYQNLEIDALVMRGIIVKLCQILNKNRHLHSDLKTRVIFDEIEEELYEESHQKLTNMYDSLAQEYFVNEEPYSSDYVIDCFQEVRNIVLDRFQNNLNLDEEKQQTYFDKLLEYIDQKERLVLEVNKKKNQFKLKKQLEEIEVTSEDIKREGKVKKLFEVFTKLADKYEHANVELMSEYLLKIEAMVGKRQRKIQYKVYNRFQEKEKELSEEIYKQSCELEKIQQEKVIAEINNKIKEEEHRELESKNTELGSKIILLRKQVQEATKKKKQIQEQKRLTKLERETQEEQLKETIKDLEDKQRENEEILEGIREEMNVDPERDRMERKLQSLSKECEKLESRKSFLCSIATQSNRVPTDHPINYTFFEKT